MKALKVRHHLSVAGVGKEQHHPDRLHKKAMREDDDAVACISRCNPSVCEPANRLAGTLEKQSERLRAGTINECGVLPLPVGDDIGFAIHLTCAPMQRGVEEAELLD